MRVCTVDDCDRSGRLVRGWCQKHYTRWRVHGDPHVVLPRGRSDPPLNPTLTCEYCGTLLLEHPFTACWRDVYPPSLNTRSFPIRSSGLAALRADAKAQASLP